MKNAISLRERFARGDSLTGMIDFIGAPMVIEILARAGIDFVIIDMEHCPMDMDRLAHLIRAADAAGIAPLVRVPEVDAGLIKRILNLAAAGIVIPHGTHGVVRGSWCAPRATRRTASAAPVRSCARPAIGPTTGMPMRKRANREVMLLPLIEDAAAIDELEEIAAIPGIDGLFLGPYDLSVSVGAPGADFNHPKMSEALDRTVAACRQAFQIRRHYRWRPPGARLQPASREARRSGPGICDRRARAVAGL